MRSIPKPTDRASDIFKSCIADVQDKRLKRKLTATIPEIAFASNVFERKAPKSKLHTIPKVTRFNSGATAKEVSRIYTNRMVRKSSPGRPIYQKLLNSAPLDICPLCGQRPVSTLDHYLDKSDYPQFAVTPVNLIPSCKDCNFSKSTFPIPSSANDLTIHPYFDDIDQHTWLTCRVLETKKPKMVFAVTPHNNWSPLLADRVQRHFQVFDLRKLYSIQAGVELNIIRRKMTDLFKNGGPRAVKEQLERDARSHKAAYRNSWSTAMYVALSKSTWFHQEGVKRI